MTKTQTYLVAAMTTVTTALVYRLDSALMSFASGVLIAVMIEILGRNNDQNRSDS